MAEVALETRGLFKRFGSTIAVAGVDFKVARGEIRALIGENGAGKSTLSRILSGVHPPDAGEILLEGSPYRPASPREARERGVSMVHQELALAPHLSIAENLFLGMEPSRFFLLDRSEMRPRTRDALGKLEHGELSPDARVGALSTAEQQIVEIARALLLEARVLLLDEPTGSLSRKDVERLFRILRGLAERGLAIVYISHFLEEVFEIATTYTVLRDGRSVAEGKLRGTTVRDIVRAMVGRDIQEMFPRSRRARGEAILEVSELRGRRLPRSASLVLHRGEVLGIAGLIGAGRTELVRAIYGLAPVRSGKVRVGSFTGPLNRITPHDRLRQGAGLLSEDRKGEGLAAIRSVAENLTLTRLDGLGPLGLVVPRRRDAAARTWIDSLAIQCGGPGQRVSELSGGNQQKVAVARLLYHDLDVLLLDEPTRGIDVASKAALYRLIDELALAGKAILLVSSYLPELLGIADRVAVMRRGELLEPAPVEAVNEETLMAKATV
jgi:ribose transport system ATP-binding protein